MFILRVGSWFLCTGWWVGVCCGVGLRFVVFPLTVFVTVVAFAVAWFLLVFGTTVVSFNSVVLYCSCAYGSLLYCLIDCVIVLLFLCCS